MLNIEVLYDQGGDTMILKYKNQKCSFGNFNIFIDKISEGVLIAMLQSFHDDLKEDILQRIEEKITTNLSNKVNEDDITTLIGEIHDVVDEINKIDY